jgi:hypothetical protein
VNTTPTKTMFQLVYAVLCDLHKEVQAEFGDEADGQIKQAISQLSSSYSRLGLATEPTIDYSSPSTRFAYVYKYVATHADYVRQVFEMYSEYIDQQILAKAKPVVSCLGGGPGSELLGLLQYVLSNDERKTESLTCYLCDREQAWADSWTELGGQLEGDINLYVNFQPLDVTNPSSWAKQRKFLGADLFISCYFASEIARLEDKTVAFWEELGASIKVGAKIVFIDNNSPMFVEYIQNIAKHCGLTTLDESTVDMYPRSLEQKSDFKEFLDKFGQSPKLKSKIFYGVYTKE